MSLLGKNNPLALALVSKHKLSSQQEESKTVVKFLSFKVNEYQELYFLPRTKFMG